MPHAIESAVDDGAPHGSTAEHVRGVKKEYAFNHPTGACAARRRRLASAIVRGTGVMPFETVQVALREPSRQAAYRTLRELVECKCLRRVRIKARDSSTVRREVAPDTGDVSAEIAPGASGAPNKGGGFSPHVWGSTRLLSMQSSNCLPGTRFFPAGNAPWLPHREFVHDDLAQRALFGLEQIDGFHTERELAPIVPEGFRLPDGLFTAEVDGRESVVEVELCHSKQTGRNRGLQAIAEEIVDIFGGFETAWCSPWGTVNTILVIALRSDIQSIAERVLKRCRDVHPKGVPRWWTCEILDAGGNSLEHRSDINLHCRLGDVFEWRAGSPKPCDTPVLRVWSPAMRGCNKKLVPQR